MKILVIIGFLLFLSGCYYDYAYVRDDADTPQKIHDSYSQQIPPQQLFAPLVKNNTFEDLGLECYECAGVGYVKNKANPLGIAKCKRCGGTGIRKY